MGWLQKLIETYDGYAGASQFDLNPPPPIGHTPKQAHIEIVIDEHGHFRRANILQKEQTLIPVTEESAGRTSTAKRPHPLCDKIQYVAADYPDYGGIKPSLFAEYLAQLAAWCQSSFASRKAQAVLDYVGRKTVVADLVKARLLHLGSDGKLLTRWPADAPKPDIFRLLPAVKFDQGDAFIRWEVAIAGDLSRTVAYYQVGNNAKPKLVSGDLALQSAWVGFNASRTKVKGLCMASGAANVALARNHPKGLRHPGDGAKLISANDKSGFTFRGRFTDKTGDQACSIGYDASQKAHLALRWLIGRQGYRNDDQAVVSWSVGGQEIPDPLADPFTQFGFSEAPAAPAYEGDAGQAYALALKRKIEGYRSDLPTSASIVVMALDSATPGRLAISFYREFGGGEFLDRIESWHERFAWHQNFGKVRKFIGAPAPRDIAEAAYSSRKDEALRKLRKACVERLLPCLIDGQPLPRDLVDQTFRRAIRRVGLEIWDWEKTLGVACALFRGYQHQTKKEDFSMALECERNTRDYLFGRLLAYAERIEERALYVAGEKRDTHAAKLMQRFADHPSSTWRQIEGLLGPSKSRLRSRRPPESYVLLQQLDQIFDQFECNDFTDDRKLTAEFLLGYHCQRAKLNQRNAAANSPEALDASDTEETL
jgi:CRISPR-associated protein Csd1